MPLNKGLPLPKITGFTICQSISPFGPAKKPSSDTIIDTITFLMYFPPFGDYFSVSEAIPFASCLFQKSRSSLYNFSICVLLPAIIPSFPNNNMIMFSMI